MSYVGKNLMPGEEVLLRPRYHWVRFVPAAGISLLGVAVAATGLVLAPAAAQGAAGPPDFQAPLLVIAGFVVLAGLLGMGWRALVDSFDEFAVTSSRVIKKSGFLTRNVRQIPLEKIQDVTVRSTIGGRWLSYGDVELQTAGSDSTVLFPRILHPEEFRNVLFTHTRLQTGGSDGLGGRVAAAPATRSSVEERLKEIDRLFKSGALSQAEYQEKRQALIREL